MSKATRKCGFVLRFDGASKGNPGLSSAGYVIVDDELVFASGGRVLENKMETNNVAEYTGLIDGLERAKAIGLRGFAVEGDSRLVIEQTKGAWKTKKAHLIPLRVRAQALVKELRVISLTWIPRDKNSLADAECNNALDNLSTII